MTDTKTTILSLTPLPLDRDSRALKIAVSLGRNGFRSIVLENRPSASRDDALPVELITLGTIVPRRRIPTDFGGVRPENDPVTRLKGALGPWLPRWIRERLHLLCFVVAYFLLRPIQGFFAAPGAAVYYLHEYRLFPLVRLLRLRRPGPLIYDAHDDYMRTEAPDALSPFWRRRFMPLLGWMERKCVQHADAVVTVSDGVADLIGERCGVRPRVIRNCHDSRNDRPPPVRVREKIGLGDDAFLIVVVGNRKPGQAIDQMIEALTRLPGHIHVAFVGRFYEGVEKVADRHGVGARVHLPGPVRPRQIVPFIETADAAGILYFAHTENNRFILPNGFFQSIAAGLPLIFPDLPELTQAVGGRDVGEVVDPLDPGSIRRGVLGLMANSGVLARRRENARGLAAELSWEHEETAVIALVRERLTDAGRG